MNDVSTSTVQTVPQLLSSASPGATALLTPNGETLTYAELGSTVASLSSQLSSFGIRRGDRVAILLDNGPLMAVTFLAVISVACAAPLNPKYRSSEIDYYLDDIGAKAIITSSDFGNSRQRDISSSAMQLSLQGLLSDPILVSDHQTGSWTPDEPMRPEDTALVLHTSGTTSRPKLVPLRHSNLVYSAQNIAQTLNLEPRDRSLNVMPLFHIHGLLAGLLAPLSAGGSVVTTEGFDAFSFFSQLERFRPTFYSAVPTMHQMVLSRSKSYRDLAAESGLRFVRSSSASLPPPVYEELLNLFKVPVIEAYGMTEATHQMCCNPLPPETAKPGSVGLPTGLDLCILAPDGSELAENQVGEISIRGPSVIEGYEDNVVANQESFTSGWFRTGDEGYVDSDGYVFLTGRLKEQINRGGEKISPLEVDSALLTHPDVDQALTFAIPHDKLGEEVAAAVVLSPGSSVSESQIRGFVSERLAAFKVPRRILVLEELPKGPTGKLQRIGLASRLGLGD